MVFLTDTNEQLSSAALLIYICLLLLLFAFVSPVYASDSNEQNKQTIPLDKTTKSVVYLEGEAPREELIDGVTYEIGIRKPGSADFHLLRERTSGTGFFIRRANKLFLATAGHVAKKLAFNGRIITADANGNSKPYTLDTKIKWIFSKKADVAVANIDDALLISTFLNDAVDIGFLPESEDSPVPELPLVVIGFPLGLGIQNKFSPLRRETHAASGLIDLKRADIDQISTFFILQDPSIGGYSGAPVFVIEAYRFGNTIMIGFDAKSCIGIIHGTMSDNTGGKLGLVTPAHYIYELIK